jgi:hypothetical protein
MPPAKIRSLLRKYGEVEIVHITRRLSERKNNSKTEPRYGAFAIIKTKENEFVFQRQSYDQPDVTREDWIVPGGKLEENESL